MRPVSVHGLQDFPFRITQAGACGGLTGQHHERAVFQCGACDLRMQRGGQRASDRVQQRALSLRKRSQPFQRLMSLSRFHMI